MFIEGERTGDEKERDTMITRVEIGEMTSTTRTEGATKRKASTDQDRAQGQGPDRATEKTAGVIAPDRAHVRRIETIIQKRETKKRKSKL